MSKKPAKQMPRKVPKKEDPQEGARGEGQSGGPIGVQDTEELPTAPWVLFNTLRLENKIPRTARGLQLFFPR